MAKLIQFLNGLVWSNAMLVLIIGTGIYFSIRLHFFQFLHHGDMWRRALDRGDSVSGISPFASFCTTASGRIGTGNVAGVAVAIYYGGPGALFWMWLVAIFGSVVAFVECSLGQLYKEKIDGEYRCSSAQIAARGLGWKTYGKLMALITMIGAGLFMPAAATNTICDAFYNACGIPAAVSAGILAAVFFLIVTGGIKRIAKFSAYAGPIMTVLYTLVAILIIIFNIGKVPGVIILIFQSAFNRGAVMGGIRGGLMAAVLQGVKRGTFSSGAGMGEATPAAAAAETSHPIKVGMSNAASVFLDTIVVCTATGLMILLTGCYNTDAAIGGYQSAISALQGQTGGIAYVQEAVRTIIGQYAPLIVAVIYLLFAFTCVVNYFYETETSALYLFSQSARARKITTWTIRLVMTGMVAIWGVSNAKLAWDAADLALGSITWINVIMLLFMFPRVRVLYFDYERQMRAGQDPAYDPTQGGLCWKGVDKELWAGIYKTYRS